MLHECSASWSMSFKFFWGGQFFCPVAILSYLSNRKALLKMINLVYNVKIMK